MSIEDRPDRAYIRRALEIADLDAVRVTLFQLTADPALKALPLAVAMNEAQRAELIDRATDWLVENAEPRMLPEPSGKDLRQLMDLAIGGPDGAPMGDLEFEARRDLTAFRDFPYAAEWTGERPKIPEDFKVVIIGSGFAGVTMAVQLDLLGIPYMLLERRAEAGGVWSINRYPDVRVDTSSMTYEFGFVKDYIWSEYFGRGREVREYISSVSRRFGVDAHSHFEHDVQRATFDEARDLWVLDVDTPEGHKTIEANAVVSCSGLFATPNYPDFQGQESFKGEIVHPSRWPDGLDLTDKRVATIGNGSTGVQMLNVIANKASQVHVFQRTPQWISPRANYGQPLTEETNWLLRNFPGYWNWSRFTATAPLFDTHKLMLPDNDWRADGGLVNPGNDAARKMLTEYIIAETGGRKDLVDRLVPSYAPFTRRPVVDNGWYRALTRDNVELVTDPIAELVPEGIKTADGQVREVDVIVTATGFEIVKYLWPTRYTGIGGIDLHDSWDAGDGPRAYIGLMHPGFPNFYTLYGPNSQPVSGGPATPVWFATWAAFAAKGIMRMIETGSSRITVTAEAYDRYNAALDREAEGLVLMNDAGSTEKNYYVNNDHRRLQVNAPWYSPDYYRMCSQVEWSDMTLSGQL